MRHTKILIAGTGQGFQDFFGATPGTWLATFPAATGTVPAAPPGGGYDDY